MQRRSLVGLLTRCRSKPLTDFRPEGGNPGCTPKSYWKQRLSNNEKRRPLTRKRLNSCDETATRRSRTGAGRGRLLQNCIRERAPISALFLPPNFSLVPDWNKFRQAAVTLHTELQQTRGVAFSTKVWNHAAYCCFSAPLPRCKIIIIIMSP